MAKTMKEMEQLKKEKVETLIGMGGRMHKMVRDGQVTDEVAVQLSGKVSQIDVELYKGSNDRIPTQGDGICPGCGEALTSSVAVFCGNCGMNVKEFYSQDMFPCSKCGQLTKATASYCSICGVRYKEGVGANG